MKPNTRIAIAALLHSAGKAFSALASEFGGVEAAGEPATTEPSTPAEPPAAKRTRKGAAAAPAVADPAPEPVVPAEEPAEPAEAAEVPFGVMTFDELKALIEPFVKNNQGADVKKLIAKYDPDSAQPSIKTMPAKNHAAFEKDIQALGY